MKQEIRQPFSVNGVSDWNENAIRGIRWGHLSVKNGELKFEFGYVERQAARVRAFKRELEAELDRMRVFLGLES
jgi:hypothetical protein